MKLKPDDHQPLNTQLRSLIQADNIAEVEELLNRNRLLANASIFYETEKSQRPVKCLVLPLTIAAIFGRVAILEMLLSKFNTDVNAPIGTGSPSLHLAAEYGWLVAATRLLSHGADINRIDVWGWTALHHACRNARTDVVRFFLEKGANSRLRANGRRTAFSLACSQGSLQLLNLLWNQGPEAQISMPDLRGHQPLHHAAGDCYHRVIPWLLEKQADIEARGEIGLTPLCVASIAGSFEATEALLLKGANIHAKSTIEKATPILYASQMLNSRLSLLLLEAAVSLADTDQRI
ncbi:nacht and ankyrin domain protein [Fusarium subglutinans]|uniref:Nacht and ankyrin domain protein n=1 Tax=Gibberella subglutinans TaxID=42677 RepID=A0A8H5UUD3_GIBSU|nr:nacht and ankyrin domain protein [Fusarium subglutinans]KAF5597724.1 nacht and ankyrin domain protein [Fusarium subglutinans]